MMRSNRKNDQKANKKKAGEKKEEKEEQVGERPANSYEQYGTSSHGRKKNKSDRGKGKNIELMRKHYGIIRRRQTKITDYLMLGDVRRLARRPNKSHSYCLNCRAQMEEASRREPVFIDLDDYEEDEEGDENEED